MVQGTRVLFVVGVLLTVAVMAVGCSTPSGSSSPGGASSFPLTDEVSPPSAEEATADGIPADSLREELRAEEAVRLAAEGAKRYWYVAGGGDMSRVETVEVGGMEYRFLGESIATQEKLMDFLQEVYTEKAAASIVESLHIVEVEGRLAQPNADGGSLLRWDEAQATLVNGDGGRPEFELKVPVGETDDFQLFRLQAEYVKEAGWRLAQVVE